MQKLKIWANIEALDEEKFVCVVDRWIEFFLQKRVQELEIWIGRYDLPPTIFTSKSLRNLSLKGIMHPLVTNTKLSSLRKLCLSDVSLNEETFQDLISKCPNVDEPKEN